MLMFSWGVPEVRRNCVWTCKLRLIFSPATRLEKLATSFSATSHFHYFFTFLEYKRIVGSEKFFPFSVSL